MSGYRGEPGSGITRLDPGCGEEMRRRRRQPFEDFLQFRIDIEGS